MKTVTVITVILSFLIFSTISADCQVRINLKERINREANRRANGKTDKAVRKGFDELEKGIKCIFTKEDSTAAAQQQGADPGAGQNQSGTAGNAAGTTGGKTTAEALTLNWAKYDFVPGDNVIFEDNLAGEENGEFPSRWDLHDGNIEVAALDGENIIMFREYGSTIIPYMKEPQSDYLPDIFTVEFDTWIPHDAISVYLYDMKNQSSPKGRTYLDVWGDGMEFSPASSKLPGGEKVNNQWAHVAVAYTKGQLKAYLNETRLINIPHLSFNPTGISIRALHSSDKSHYYIKNIRIAEGGVKYYDRFMQDGKIIANGIRFDVNKATLKPESMGVINEIASLMKEHPDISFSVEGHTDSDGDADMNQTLSEDRAETVRNQLISMGISADRLSSKGFGESMPINTNNSPEGKAENRRVEFVKK
ncbi:MAG TPA: OmpA family protein [Bacteroidales bacterium]|nr:OmpA family protein [Bacteroidales bacterium]